MQLSEKEKKQQQQQQINKEIKSKKNKNQLNPYQAKIIQDPWEPILQKNYHYQAKCTNKIKHTTFIVKNLYIYNIIQIIKMQYSDNEYSPRTNSIHNKLQINNQILKNEQEQTIQELKIENNRIKKMLKQTQAKRNMLTKQCAKIQKEFLNAKQEINILEKNVQMTQGTVDNRKYKVDELKFLNKNLTTEIEQLRAQNQDLNQKLRYHSDVLEKKYEEIQENTIRRIERAIKRVKKSQHYLQVLSTKEIQKTKQIIVENLKKVVELLHGKYTQDKFEEEIQQLMNPLKSLQEEVIKQNRQIIYLKQTNIKLQEQVNKHQQVENELLPNYKDAIEKLKKNLGQVRTQLSQNQYDKGQLKKKYQQKIKLDEKKYNQLSIQYRKIKLQRNLFEKKLEQLQADVEEDKQRLLDENQMLKKLYQNVPYETELNDKYTEPMRCEGNNNSKKTQQKKYMNKNYSSKELKSFKIHNNNEQQQNLCNSFYHSKSRQKFHLNNYDQESSIISQEGLKNEIFKIDQQIMQIQKNLHQQLNAYK